MWPVVCPRSSQSKDSHPPSFFTVMYPPSRPANTPAVVRKPCSRRSAPMETIHAESRIMLSRKRPGNRRTSCKSNDSAAKGISVLTLNFSAQLPGYTDWAYPHTVTASPEIITIIFFLKNSISLILKFLMPYLSHNPSPRPSILVPGFLRAHPNHESSNAPHPLQ